MSLFGRKEKKEIALLREQLSPEQTELVDINQQLEVAKAKLEKIEKKISSQNAKLAELKKQIIETDETSLLQSFGLYEPLYSFNTSDEYKKELAELRTAEKDFIKEKSAVTGATNWTLNGSAAQGKKMISDMQKLLLRAFNAECDSAIEHVKFNNIETCEKRIDTAAKTISNLGKIMGLSISGPYYMCKYSELHLTYEYQLKKQEEKEAQKEARARMREEAKLAKELEEARKNIEKEQKHYTNALKKLNEQIFINGETSELLAKKEEISSHLNQLEGSLKAVDYRAANQKAGYVYVISNIGAFGEGVYKIGMTRRLDPMDRIDELGDASVPFNFDVHAMIFTDDAPGLEAALHRAFADRKLNFVNTRREFFRVSLDEIKDVIKKNFDQTVEFVDIAPAEQYRQSLLLSKVASSEVTL